MKQVMHRNRIWQILYPLGVYYVMYNILYSILGHLFKEVGSSLLWLGVASAITIPFMYSIYNKMPIIRAEKQLDKTTLLQESLFILGIVLLGVAFNVLISHTGLMEQSKGFAEANAVFEESMFLTKVFANVICIPILEELLYRGIIAGQIRIWYGTLPAAIISSLLFGVLHFNMIQFLYAFLVGMALSYVYTKTSKLWVVIFAHGLTNLVVVLWNSF